MKPFHYLWVLLFLMGLSVCTHAQSYLKSLSQPEISSKQKITTFKNGDILIGDSAFEGSLQGTTAPLFLTRMDKCGLIVWSNAYEIRDLQLEFRDFTINEQDQIFVFGSALDGLRESIFLLKVDGQGQKEGFRSFNSGAASSSSFSLSLQNDKILTLGRLLEIGTSTTGFFAIFDTNLNFQWGKRIAPFTFEGAVIIDKNGEFVARSKALHYKFEAGGTLQWAKEFDLTLDPEPLAGPIEVTNGYLYEAFYQDQAFFYKLGFDGELLWKSPLIPSTPFPATVQEISGGNLIAHYSSPESVGNSLMQLRLSATGEITQQQKLKNEFSFNVGSVFHAFSPNDQVVVIGNNDALTTAAVDLTDYLIQFSLDAATPGCFEWLDVASSTPNNYLLDFTAPSNINISDLSMRDTFRAGLETYPREMPYLERCGATLEPSVIEIDTLISCDESWLVSLPSEAFNWEDNFQEPTRLLENTGIYRAKNSDCEDPMIYEYHLEKAICDCQVFLPNAFSPNGDGQNDVMQLFTNCPVTEIKTTIYDRWGNLISQGQNAEQIWDGTSRQIALTEGIYIIMVNYQLLSESGGIQNGSLTQEVLLIR